MNANSFKIKPYDNSLGVSILVDLYNKMKKYLNPESTVLITEEVIHTFLGKETVLSRDFIIFETNQNNIVALAGISRMPFFKDAWLVIYAILPEYFESELPGVLIDAVLNLGKKLNAPGLIFQTFGVLSAPLEEKLESIGINPAFYNWSMHLDNFKLFSKPDIPQDIIIRDLKKIEDYTSFITIINEAFKDSFKFQPFTTATWKMMDDMLKKTFSVEYCIVYENNKLVGGCIIHFNLEKDQIGLISTLCVLPNYQHRKIGTGLLAFGIETLHKRGCKKFELSVETKNERALGLYKKFGFKVKKNMTQKTYQII